MKEIARLVQNLAYQLKDSRPVLSFAGATQLLDIAFPNAIDQRWRRSLAWTRTAQPKIICLGDTHPHFDEMNAVRRRELALTDAFKQFVDDRSIIVIETHGPGSRLTEDQWLRIMRDRFRQIGRRVNDAQVLAYLRKTNDTVYGLLKSKPHIEIIFGEDEAACCFHISHMDDIDRAKFREMRAVAEGSPAHIANQLDYACIKLRSALTFLRTLEYLERSGGRKAIIIQGTAHLPDIAQFAHEAGCTYAEYVL